MEQSTITEHDCNVLGGLFQIIIADLKNGTATWEDFILKATKLQTHLKSTIAASTAFLDAFQKVADMATITRGGTKEIGTSLTRLCLRQRSVEAKLKSFSSAFLDCLIMPLQERVEEWKKTTIQLDKERTKELKRLRQEFKKSNKQSCDSLSTSGSIRNKKHGSRLSKSKFDFLESLNSKGIYGTIGGMNHKHSSSLTRSLDSETECNERLLMLEELEKKAVRRALIEERSHFCMFVKFLRPLIEEELSMISEMSHIEEIMNTLLKLTADPFDLPVSSENVLSNLKLNKNDSLVWNLHTPPSSPSSLGSRKSSMCSISSYNSSSSNSNYGQTNQIKSYFPPKNISSECAYDSGFLYEPKKQTNRATSITSEGSDCNHINNSLKELQFQIDCGESDKSVEKNTIKITSTNPFLNSYNQIHFEQCVYDKNTTTISTITNNHNSDHSGNINNNAGYLMPNNQESDGSITPTNTEGNHFKNSIYKSNKPPPTPPVRRTSSLSNPNAITMGTLKNVACNENCKDIGKNNPAQSSSSSLYDEINVLTKSMNDINFTLKNTDFSNSDSLLPKNDDCHEGKPLPKKSEYRIAEADPNSDKSDYKNVKKIFENLKQTQSNIFKSTEDDGSQLPLPAPPPEAFVDSATAVTTLATTTQNISLGQNQQALAHHPHHHYNKITNVHREFLETLNSKLSQSPPLVYHHNSAKISKRRSSQQSPTADDYIASSYSGKHRMSSRSSSASRAGSRKNSIEKNNGFNALTMTGSSYGSIENNGNFVDKLSQSILQKQQHSAQLAKAAACTALQRKQSVPDLNELNPNNLKQQARVSFSSSLNLSNTNQAFQVVDIHTNPPQQPIYASRTQLREEMQNLYGTLPTNNVYLSDRSYAANGFFNKL